jgi:hypothetical protein
MSQAVSGSTSFRMPMCPSRIWLYEVYKDEAAFQAHTQAPHFLKFRDATKDWRAEGPQGAGRGASNIWPPDNQWQ